MSNTPFENLHTDHDMGEHQPDIPPRRLSNQPPNLNLAVRGHGGSPDGGQNIGEGDEGGSESDGDSHMQDGSVMDYDLVDDESLDENRSVNGDEGLEDHLIEVGDLGMIPIRTVMISLARHRRCTCHAGVIPPADDYPFSVIASPTDSGIISPSYSSLIVERGSTQPSLSSSCVSFGYHDAASPGLHGLFDYLTGGISDEEVPFHHPLPTNFVRDPMWLSPTLEVSTHYPLEVSLS